MALEPSTLQDIEASVYYGDLSNDRYYVKIAFVGIGIYVNSFSVMPSKFENQHYWVQPPKHLQKGKGWTPTVDFDKSYPIWEEIERKAIEAVELYKSQDSSLTQKPVIDGIPEGLVSLEDIPF